MPIQYPDFRADPNGAPKISGWPSFIESLSKGYQLAQMPQQVRDQNALRQAQLSKAQSEAQYYPQMQQAALESQQQQNQYNPSIWDSQINESNAKTGLTNQQTRLYPQLTASEISKNNAEAAKARQGENGIFVGVDDKGNPIVQIGGSGSGGARSGGRLGTDSEGNITSELTTGNKTTIQNRKIGEDIAAPFIKQIIDTLPQFQTATKRTQSAVSGVANQIGLSNFIDNNPYAQIFGLDSTLPSQKAAGEAALTSAAEGLLKASALHNTGENFTKIRKVVEPVRGESAKGYEDRIRAYFKTIEKNTGDSQKKLATGIPTGLKVAGAPASIPNSTTGNNLKAIAGKVTKPPLTKEQALQMAKQLGYI